MPLADFSCFIHHSLSDGATIGVTRGGRGRAVHTDLLRIVALTHDIERLNGDAPVGSADYVTLQSSAVFRPPYWRRYVQARPPGTAAAVFSSSPSRAWCCRCCCCPARPAGHCSPVRNSRTGCQRSAAPRSLPP